MDRIKFNTDIYIDLHKYQKQKIQKN